MYIIWERRIMTKTLINKKQKKHKNTMKYRKLRRWVLPAILGAALSTLAMLPTFAAETQTTTNVATVTTTVAPNGAPPSGSPNGAPSIGMAPQAEVNPTTFTATAVVTERNLWLMSR